MNYSVIDEATGLCVAIGTGHELPTIAGHLVIDAAGQIGQMWNGTSFVAQPENVQTARDICWAAAKAVRDSIMVGGCDTPSGQVQTDDDSQRKVGLVATAAIAAKAAGADWSASWTMADNSSVQVDADAMIAIGAAVGTFLSKCQEACSAVRSKIDAATNAVDIRAIDLRAGYPQLQTSEE